MINRWEREEIKNGRVTYIAPLRPPTVAAFRPWRGSAGAGRIRLCRHKDNKKQVILKLFPVDPCPESTDLREISNDGPSAEAPVALHFPVRVLNFAMPTSSSARPPGAR
jgi:hypothetical protein